MDIENFYFAEYKTKNIDESVEPLDGHIYVDSNIFKDIKNIKIPFKDKNNVDVEGWVNSFNIGKFIKIMNSSTLLEWGIYEIIGFKNYKENILKAFIEIYVYPIFIKGEKFDLYLDDLIIYDCFIEEKTNSEYLIKYYSNKILNCLGEIYKKIDKDDVSPIISLSSKSSKSSSSSSSVHGSKNSTISSSYQKYIPPVLSSTLSSSGINRLFLSVDSFSAK